MLDFGVYESLLMVGVGIGSLLNFFCIVSLGAKFCHIRVPLWAPEPQGGPSIVMAGPSPSCIIEGCLFGLGCWLIFILCVGVGRYRGSVQVLLCARGLVLVGIFRECPLV